MILKGKNAATITHMYNQDRAPTDQDQVPVVEAAVILCQGEQSFHRYPATFVNLFRDGTTLWDNEGTMLLVSFDGSVTDELPIR